jgi:hypothetical protein
VPVRAFSQANEAQFYVSMSQIVLSASEDLKHSAYSIVTEHVVWEKLSADGNIPN